MMNKKIFGINFSYKVIAIACLTLLCIKTLFSVDMNWDSWEYHFPFMARIWGIVTTNEYLMSKLHEERFKGFPLAAEFLQGLLWKFSGRVELTNLLNFSSLCAYIIFLWKYLKIPFYSSTIALLAVPLIQIHATNSYLDLFLGVCTSSFIILVYLICTRKGEVNTKNVILLLLLGGLAGNTKFQAFPVIFITYIVLILKLLFTHEKEWFGNFSKKILISIIFLGTLLACGTYIKNIILYANPFYPINFSLGLLHFHGTEEQYSQVPEYLKNYPKIVQWFFSVTEIDFLVRKLLWQQSRFSYIYNLDMNLGDEKIGSLPVGGRTGGYFGLYVVFHAFLLIYFYIKSKNKKVLDGAKERQYKNNDIVIICLCFTLLTLFSSFLPQSLELRYYLYWIIILITANLYIASNCLAGFFNLRKVNFISTFFLIAVIFITRLDAFRPLSMSFQSFKENNTDPQLISQIQNMKQPVCLENYVPFAFLYATPFNKGNYSLRDGNYNAQKNCSQEYKVFIKSE